MSGFSWTAKCVYAIIVIVKCLRARAGVKIE